MQSRIARVAIVWPSSPLEESTLEKVTESDDAGEAMLSEEERETEIITSTSSCIPQSSPLEYQGDQSELFDLDDDDDLDYLQAYPSPSPSQFTSSLPSTLPLPSAQPIPFRLSPSYPNLTPFPTPPQDLYNDEDSFDNATPRMSPDLEKRNTRSPNFSVDDEDDELLDAVVRGIANVSVNMNRDQAGRWRIQRRAGQSD